MARHNFVSVTAFVKKLPAFLTTVDGQVGLISLTTIMGPRDIRESTTGYQTNSVSFCARSRDGAMLEAMKSLKLYDLVSVEGFLATKECDKSAACPFCGTVNKRTEACVAHGINHVKHGGNIIFVYPLSMDFIQPCKDPQEAYQYLHAHRETTNKVFIMGNLTRQPINGTLEQGKRKYTRFQIAVNRKYHPKGGTELYERTDYPWIYSYGDKSTQDFEVLEKGDLVFVDGALQARKYKEQYVCGACGQTYDVPGRTLEVLSYDTEYLRLSSHGSGQEPA